MSNVPSRTAGHGKGRAVLQALSDSEAVFSALSYRYPLKLLSPRTHGGGTLPVGIAYMLSYGGGLVGGDRIELEVNVGQGSALMLLTQGSTKVFKARSQTTQSALGINPATVSTALDSSSSSDPGAHAPTTATAQTTQRLNASLEPGSFLLLLPDPVTPFADSSYSQTQTFHLPSPSTDVNGATSAASAVILDWFTSGRMARDEQWAFERYRSVNEIWIGKKRVARDVMLLEQHSPTTFTSPSTSLPDGSTSAPPRALPPRSLHARLSPYACYATLFLIGPLCTPVIATLSARFAKIQVMQTSKPEALLWAISPLSVPASSTVENGKDEGGQGAIVRVMGMSTESVREWIKEALSSLVDTVGMDALRAAFV